MTSADVGKHEALKLDPREYIQCSELRKIVCPVFADVELDKGQVRTQWPERAVPAAILQGAQGMDGAVATEQADALVSPLDLPAEFVIGIQEEDAHDPVDLMIVFQKSLELVQEAGKRIHNLEQRGVQAKGTCLLYTSPRPRDRTRSRMTSSA